MGVVVAPIKVLYSQRTIAGQELAPQEECEVQMTNPHPQPADPNLVRGPELKKSATQSTAQPDSLLIEEIRILRERGLTDECIHGLFSGFNIDARPEPSGQHWNIPMNDQLIRLIWGKALPTAIHLD